MKKWALKYNKCKQCSKADKPHNGHGLCTACYYRVYREAKTKEMGGAIITAWTLGLTRAVKAIDKALQEYGHRCWFDEKTWKITLEFGDTKIVAPTKGTGVKED